MKKISAEIVKKIERKARFLVRMEGAFTNKAFHPLRMPMRPILESTIDGIFDRAYVKVGELKAEAYVTTEPLPFERRFEGVKKELAVGKAWADKVFDCAWIHVTGTLPKASKNLAFMIDIGGEGLVYDRDGHPKQGITTYVSQYSYNLGQPYKVVVLPDGLVFGNQVDFYIDGAANDLFGNFLVHCAVGRLDIVEVHNEIRNLFYDISVLMGVYDCNRKCPETEEIYKKVCHIVLNSRNLTDEKATGFRAMLAPLLAKKSNDDMTFYAMGHAHLDLAWLWPLRETIRKGGRTFASQIMNLERYPSVVFGEGQAQLYQWMKDNYPDLFAKAKELHRQGRWELQGAPWVESDTNLISGESMIRQFYYGKKFFKEEFGEDVKLLWLPDTFGYSACLPEVMNLAGVKYFLTTRLGYNKAEKFPSTFNWEGLDGSKALVHIVPDGFYNSPANVYFLKRGKHIYSEKDKCKKAVNLYGIGDGGGGPGFEHYERIVREQDLFGCPKVKSAKVCDFFQDIDGSAEFPTCKGELYLEQFRGTYTSHSNIKYFNRKIEIALRNYELLAVIAKQKALPMPITEDKLEVIWKEVLLYQFHDILPGSSINRVYEECEERYKTLLSELYSAIQTLAQSFGGIINPNPFDYSGAIQHNGVWKRICVPAYSGVSVANATDISTFYAKSGADFIENDAIKVTFKGGYIASVYDKKLQKEAIAPGKLANVISSHLDVGNCWSIRPKSYALGYKGKAKCTSFATQTDGASAIAKVTYKIGKSTISQTIAIKDGESMITFDGTIDYQEKCNVLRVCFPTTVKSPVTNYNIQFGHIARGTTDGNPIDKAQFEVPAHKFYDISNNGYGISLLNDCKYGMRCRNGKMYLTLFRSPLGGPGHDIDKGTHTFTYALYLHNGALGSDTYQRAYELNNPLILTDRPTAGGKIYTTTNKNIILEGAQMLPNGKVAFRFYNSTPESQTAEITLHGFADGYLSDIFGNKLKDFHGTLTLDKFGLAIITYKY